MKTRKKNTVLICMLVLVIHVFFLYRPIINVCFMIASFFKFNLFCNPPCTECAITNAEIAALKIENNALKSQLMHIDQLMGIAKKLQLECEYAKVLHHDPYLGQFVIQSESNFYKYQAVISSGGYAGKIIQTFGSLALVESLRCPEYTGGLAVVLMSEHLQIQAVLDSYSQGVGEAFLLEENPAPAIGMSVLTSPLSIYPSFVPVGEVIEVFTDITGTHVKIELSAVSSEGMRVCVVKNSFKKQKE